MAVEVAPVTVAIATFNRAAMLLDALRSCRRQTLRPENIVVVDDGSSDGTAQAVASLSWPEIIYVNPGKVGLGRARNIATSLTRTEYLCIMDDDDIMLPNRIRDHMNSFKSGVQMSHGGWINFNAGGELEFRPGKKVTEDVIVYAGKAITHGACCYVTDLLAKVPYRENIVGGVDFDLAVRLVRRGLACAHTQSYVILRRMHGSNLSLRHGDQQLRTRRVVVEAVSATRSKAETSARQMEAMIEPELAIEAPSISGIYGVLGKFQEALRVTVEVPRHAGQFVNFTRRLGVSVLPFEIIDPKPDLSFSLTLAFQPTRSVMILESLLEAVRRCGAAASFCSSRTMPRTTSQTLSTTVLSGQFRLGIRSVSLQELRHAYEVLAQSRCWTWYFAARQQRHLHLYKSFYWLLSAPFEIRLDAVQQEKYVRDLQAYIHEETNLYVDVIGA